MSSNREYMRRYVNARYHRRRQEAIQQLGGCCILCGSTQDLQFDHKDALHKKGRKTPRWNGMSEEKFQAELALCQLLCESCHRIKTMKDRGFSPGASQHGTLTGYGHCGPPKCEECRKAKREYM